MNRLRNRLIAIFLAATLAPLAATLWVTSSLLETSVNYTSTSELDRVSRSLEETGRELYQRSREDLKARAQNSAVKPERIYRKSEREAWPAGIRAFDESGDAERFALAGEEGDRLEYYVRRGGSVVVYGAYLGLPMERLRAQHSAARQVVDRARERDLHRGLTYTYALAASGIWVVSLALLVYLAHRVSRPIQQLTAGLTRLASGDFSVRVSSGAGLRPALGGGSETRPTDDEIGRAIAAFNEMASKLEENTARLVYLTQLASWQTLARKMAHEVKNSLTPIRLTVEEMVARQGQSDRAFLEQAAQIVVDEIESLERRIRAFSEFAAEPPVQPIALDVNALVEERIALLKNAHPEVTYEFRRADGDPRALGDQDLVKGVLTNLLENAAEAAGAGGRILGIARERDGCVSIEVHDSGPGLSEQARATLFQPTISFKKRGMGLGLSIARKSALLSGGDIVVVKGELGGAAFRVLLPTLSNGQAHPDRG